MHLIRRNFGVSYEITRKLSAIFLNQAFFISFYGISNPLGRNLRLIFYCAVPKCLNKAQMTV